MLSEHSNFLVVQARGRGEFVLDVSLSLHADTDTDSTAASGGSGTGATGGGDGGGDSGYEKACEWAESAHSSNADKESADTDAGRSDAFTHQVDTTLSHHSDRFHTDFERVFKLGEKRAQVWVL